MDNQLLKKPNYTAHRREVGAVDTTNLTTLLTDKERNALNTAGVDEFHGFVELSGTGSPTVTLEVYELVKYVNNSKAASKRLVKRVSDIGPLSDGDPFEVPCTGGGLWFLRVSALTGTTPKATIYIAAAKWANEGSI